MHVETENSIIEFWTKQIQLLTEKNKVDMITRVNLWVDN